MRDDWIGAEEACTRLGVRPQTLYAYVSRGKLHVQPDPDQPRRSLYSAADIAALTAAKSRSRKPAEVARLAIDWGEPVLASAISTTSGGKLFYRGRDAAELSKTQSLEAVSALLRDSPHADVTEAGPSVGGPDPRARALFALAARAGRDPPLLSRGAAPLAIEAQGLQSLLADALAGQRRQGPLAERLAAAWGQPAGGGSADTIRQALVLLADHELNASTFACRVAASTGASLAACLLAGLAALTGPRHGGAHLALRHFLNEAAQIGAEAALAARLAEDRLLPGFGHPLYPDGDPRAEALLARIALPPPMADLKSLVEDATGRRVNIDFALAAMTAALGLPADAPFVVFALGRSAGWIAHAIEQVQTGGLIRPRARYVGVPVG